jgi:hypothetical protein
MDGPAMSDWHTLRTWTTTNFSVELAYEYEHSPDTSWADAETLEEIESGDLTAYCFRVAVYWRQCGVELSADYLGDSFYRDPADFACEHIGLAAKARADGCNYGCYLTGMVAEAVADARKAIERMRANLPNVRNA